MALAELHLPIDDAPPPRDVRLFLREAQRRIRRFQRTCRSPAFMPSNFARAHAVLRALAGSTLAPGARFCEWGSGFGVVACLAAMLDFDACGIEIDGALAAEAQELADDFGLPVEFVHGSFIPAGADAYVDAAYARSGDGFSWLTMESDGALDELGLSTNDFDVVFVYPWPDEEGVVVGLFDRFAAVGATLVSHHSDDAFRLRRKTAERKRTEQRAGRPSRSPRR